MFCMFVSNQQCNVLGTSYSHAYLLLLLLTGWVPPFCIITRSWQKGKWAGSEYLSLLSNLGLICVCEAVLATND